MRAPILAGVLALGAWAVYSLPQPPKRGRIPISIIGQEQGLTWGHTMYAPLFSFRVLSGQVPQKGTVQLCSVVTDKQPGPTPNHTYSVISLHCEDGLVMELEGIDLSGGAQ